jgi:hypothetical protein
MLDRHVRARGGLRCQVGLVLRREYQWCGGGGGRDNSNTVAELADETILMSKLICRVRRVNVHTFWLKLSKGAPSAVALATWAVLQHHASGPATKETKISTGSGLTQHSASELLSRVA